MYSKVQVISNFHKYQLSVLLPAEVYHNTQVKLTYLCVISCEHGDCSQFGGRKCLFSIWALSSKIFHSRTLLLAKTAKLQGKRLSYLSQRAYVNEKMSLMYESLVFCSPELSSSLEASLEASCCLWICPQRSFIAKKYIRLREEKSHWTRSPFGA